MRKFLVHLLGGITHQEADLATVRTVTRCREANNRKWEQAEARLMKGDADYGVPPLERFQVDGLLTGVE